MFAQRIGAICFIAASLWSFPLAAQYTVWIDGQNLGSNFMRVYNVALPPIGYVHFCHRNPNECRQERTKLRRIGLTSERWSELVSINKYVNESVTPVSDQNLYGKLEFWTYPQYRGDCDDYVLLKRRMLVSKGWPLSSLLITVVLDENGDGHAILTARTADGDFILDNKRQEIVAWNESPYRFVKRQSYKNQRIWMSLMPDQRNASTSSAIFQQAYPRKHPGGDRSSGEK